MQIFFLRVTMLYLASWLMVGSVVASPKVRWTSEENDLMLRRMAELGYIHADTRHSVGKKIDFGDVARALPQRSTKQVREHWNAHLDPAMSRTKLSSEEMAKLHCCVQEVPRDAQGLISWTTIKDRYFPKRPAVFLKDSYRSYLALPVSGAPITKKRKALTDSAAFCFECPQKRPGDQGIREFHDRYFEEQNSELLVKRSSETAGYEQLDQETVDWLLRRLDPAENFDLAEFFADD